MTTKPPHLDTPPCPECARPTLVPFAVGADPNEAANPEHVRCASCGHDYALDLDNADDLRRLLQVWWSAGAWAGKKHTEENRK